MAAIGRNRKPRRIQEVLDNCEPRKSMADVARETGRHYQTVWSTVQGLKNNRAVLRYLLELGVPSSILDLPDDLKKTQVQP